MTLLLAMPVHAGTNYPIAYPPEGQVIELNERDPGKRRLFLPLVVLCAGLVGVMGREALTRSPSPHGIPGLSDTVWERKVLERRIGTLEEKLLERDEMLKRMEASLSAETREKIEATEEVRSARERHAALLAEIAESDANLSMLSKHATASLAEMEKEVRRLVAENAALKQKAKEEKEAGIPAAAQRAVAPNPRALPGPQGIAAFPIADPNWMKLEDIKPGTVFRLFLAQRVIIPAWRSDSGRATDVLVATSQSPGGRKIELYFHNEDLRPDALVLGTKTDFILIEPVNYDNDWHLYTTRYVDLPFKFMLGDGSNKTLNFFVRVYSPDRGESFENNVEYLAPLFHISSRPLRNL